MNLTSKTYLLTGASGGIGSAIASDLAKAGASLILVGRSEDKLQVLAKQLNGDNRQASFVLAADIASHDGLEVVRTALTALNKPLDGVIHCAGINRFRFLADTDPADIQALIATNITAPILLTRLVLPFLNRDNARIIFVGSSFGALGYPGFSVYSATKFALRGFAQALRRELADTAIQIACLSPRATQTELNSDAVCAMNRELGVTMDDPHIVAIEVKKMLLAKRMYDRNIGWPERFFIQLNKLFPWLIDKALRSQLPVVARYAESSAHRGSPVHSLKHAPENIAKT